MHEPLSAAGLFQTGFYYCLDYSGRRQNIFQKHGENTVAACQSVYVQSATGLF